MITKEDLLEALKTARGYDSDMTVSALITLLSLRLDAPTPNTDIIQQTGSNKSTISRHMSVYSNYGRGDKEGFDFFRMYDDPTDRRYRLLRMTPKGVQFVKDVLGITNESL